MKNLNRAHLRYAIQQEYKEVAENPKKGFHFISGRKLAKILGYDKELLKGIPEGAIESFAGVGNPFKIGKIMKGETVLDIGSGAGIDSLIASKMVGEKGQVIGVDITEEMLRKARRNAVEMGAANVDFVKGYAEAIPLEDNSLDVVISNGVINLSPEKTAVYNEIYRVLKPGGRIFIADVILDIPVSQYSKDLSHLWTNCVAGGELRGDYMSTLDKTGFFDIEILNSYDVFRNAPIKSSAAYYGAKGYNIRAFKPYLTQIMWNDNFKNKRVLV